MSFVFRTAEFEAARCAWEGRSPPRRKPCRLLVVCVVIPLETGELGVEVRVEHRHGVFPEIPILLIAHFEHGVSENGLVEAGFNRADVERVLAKVESQAFKRALEPPFPDTKFYD